MHHKECYIYCFELYKYMLRHLEEVSGSVCSTCNLSQCDALIVLLPSPCFYWINDRLKTVNIDEKLSSKGERFGRKKNVAESMEICLGFVHDGTDTNALIRALNLCNYFVDI